MVDNNGLTDEALRGAAGEAESASETSKNGIGDGAAAKRMVGSVLNFVQEQPWVAVAGAFVLGYIAAQFVKRME